MSYTILAPYEKLGEGGNYPIEINYGVRVYTNKNEKIPEIGEFGYSLKGGLRTNRIGKVPLLDGEKQNVGTAEVVKIVSAKPQNMDLVLLQKCGFENVEEATKYAETEHFDEFERDGVITVFEFKVVELK